MPSVSCVWLELWGQVHPRVPGGDRVCQATRRDSPSPVAVTANHARHQEQSYYADHQPSAASPMA